MKNIKNNLLWFILFWLLAACTPDVEVVQVTRPIVATETNTAVPPPPPTPIPIIAATETAVPNPTSIPTAVPSPTPIPTSETIAGWLAYHNDFFSYLLSYPPEATIGGTGVSGFPSEELPKGMTGSEYLRQLETVYPENICVGVTYKVGFITILPSAESGGRYSSPCGVTGVGAYDVVDVAETVIIDGAAYTARGTQIRERDEAATWHNELYFLTLNNGTTIQFGSTRGTQEQFLEVKETLLQIVSSYQSTGSPKTVRLMASGATLFFTRDADLWRAQPDGSGLEQLTTGGFFVHDPLDDNIVFFRDPIVSPDGRFITFINDFGTLNLIDVTGAQPVQTLDATDDEIAWAPHSHLMAYAYQSKLRLFHVTTGEVETLHDSPIAGLGNMVFSPDGRFLAYSCCFTSTGEDSGVSTGEIRVLKLLDGSETTVGETWSSIGGGTPTLCWTTDNEVMTIDDERLENPSRCSFQAKGISALSPDGTQIAYLSTLNAADDVYFRRLTVKDSTTDEILWQRDFDVLLRHVSWSVDSQQLFLHAAEEQWWPANGTRDDAIYTLPTNGSGDLELVLENAVLLDVIAAWSN